MNATRVSGPSTPMGAGRRPVVVSLTILNDNPPQFEMQSAHIPIKKGEGDDEVLTFNNWQGGQYSDGFVVTFELVDQTNKGYGFFISDPAKPGPNQAMSAKIIGPSGKCPKRGDRWDGFKPVAVSPDRQMLTVENANDCLQYFGFAFHFALDGQNKPSLTYDPVGDNQNGNLRL